MLEPAGGLRTQGSRGLRGRWRTHPRRAPPTRLAARALSQSPPEGERFGGALPEEGGQRERASRDSPLREGEKRQDRPTPPMFEPAGGLRKGLRWERGPEQRGRAPTRDAPTGGGWIPAGAGMTVSGILGFDNPRWLRGGPSSQSSPGGRRGKTSRPHPCLSPRAGCARKVAAGFVDVGGPIPAAPRRRAWRRVPSLSLPQRGRGLGAPSQKGAVRESGRVATRPYGRGRRGKTSLPRRLPLRWKERPDPQEPPT